MNFFPNLIAGISGLLAAAILSACGGNLADNRPVGGTAVASQNSDFIADAQCTFDTEPKGKSLSLEDLRNGENKIYELESVQVTVLRDSRSLGKGEMQSAKFRIRYPEHSNGKGERGSLDVLCRELKDESLKVTVQSLDEFDRSNGKGNVERSSTVILSKNSEEIFQGLKQADSVIVLHQAQNALSKLYRFRKLKIYELTDSRIQLVLEIASKRVRGLQVARQNILTYRISKNSALRDPKKIEFYQDSDKTKLR